MRLAARHFEHVFPRPALVMGIVNVTPDSFSDGGSFPEAAAAAAHGMRLVQEGAGMLDIGGESTRPGAAPVSEAEELRRVMPVLERLAGRVPVPISIDTMKPGVAQAALEAGASVVNDVAANREEEAMWRLVAETGAGYVCLHMQGTPQTMQVQPVYRDVVAEVAAFFRERLERLAHCGVRPEQVILDPGIGFGKTFEHNLELLAALPTLAGLGRPLLVGVSRKSFMARLLGTGAAPALLSGGLACAVLAIRDGAQILRVHDVAATVQAIRMAEAIQGKRRNA